MAPSKSPVENVGSRSCPRSVQSLAFSFHESPYLDVSSASYFLFDPSKSRHMAKRFLNGNAGL
jgi:hypothetical protein